MTYAVCGVHIRNHSGLGHAAMGWGGFGGFVGSSDEGEGGRFGLGDTDSVGSCFGLGWVGVRGQGGCGWVGSGLELLG